MNKIFSLLIVFLCLSIYSQAQDEKLPVYPINEKTGMITYSDVIEMPELTANELYERAFRWANKYFVNPKDVLRETDVLQGLMVCKARFMISNPPDKSDLRTNAGKVMYTLTLEFKDGRYRYTIDDIHWIRNSKYPIENWLDVESQSYSHAFADYLSQSNEHCIAVVESLKEGMNLSIEEVIDDW